MSVTLYSRNYCAACAATKRLLTRHEVEFTEVNVEDEGNAHIAQDLVDAGWRAMPVVMVWNEAGVITDSWAGLKPEKVAELSGKE